MVTKEKYSVVPSVLCEFFIPFADLSSIMAAHPDRWYFSKEQIRNTPSVRDGIDHAKEIGYRQQCANFIQDIGQRVAVYEFSPFIFVLLHSDTSI